MSTAAERQKRYREKMKIENPTKFKEMQRKNNENTKRNRKRIANFEPEEQAQIREQWKEKKRMKKNKEEIKKTVLADEKRIAKINYKLQTENKKLRENFKQAKKENKTIRKRLSRALKKNKQLIDVIQKLKHEAESKNEQEENQSITPYSKTIQFVEANLPNVSFEEKQKVKKVLLEHNVLVDTIKDHYTNTNKISEKNIFKSFVSSDIPKKYKFKTKLSSYLGLKGKIRHIQIKKKNLLLLNNLKEFFERDDVSTATAGKKETKTLRKLTKQRRYLSGTLNQLYKKYKEEGGRISFSTFKRYRPFYIIPPKVDKRDTCACKRHENLKLKAMEMKSLGLIATKSLDDLLLMVVCDAKNKQCAYDECENCKEKSVQFETNGKNLEETVSWSEWVLKSHEYTDKKNDEQKTTKKVLKERKTGTLLNLMQLFAAELKDFKKHSYNIYHQYKEYQHCLKTLDYQSVAVHIDFSENYSCKLSTEIQSMHFGASRQQFTLHTGLIYGKGKDPLSFASISPCNNHGPEAIWAHLTPVLEFIRKEFPCANSIHFFSDGPTVQYKQKKNFFLFCKFTKELGFPFSTWNFFESAHGKGAADGIGGAIKRKLDSLVSYGSDITSAECAYQLLLEKTETKIKLFYIPKILATENVQINPVPGTMALHQLRRSDWENKIEYRTLSCFCDKASNPGYCQCWDPKQHSLININTPKQTKKNKKVVKKAKDGIKNRKRSKNSKKIKKTEDSDTSIESHITYAESDNSLMECLETLDLEQLDIEELGQENTLTEDDETERKQMKNMIEDNKKVTVLEEVRYAPENFHQNLQKCFNLCSIPSKELNVTNEYHLSEESDSLDIF